jgi:hypothetical protein
MFVVFRSLIFLSLALIISGCFLPWGCWGDLTTICDPGIFVSLKYGFYYENNGGIFVILLSLLAGGIFILKPSFLIKPSLVTFLSSLVIFFYAIDRLRYWILRGVEESGRIGAATPGVGIELIFSGSMLLLILSIYRFRSTE